MSVESSTEKEDWKLEGITMATAEKVEAKSVGQLDHTAVEEISNELNHLLADSFAL
jgi:hypothetical protein